ncbi:tyrosinase [Ceratobasidium sp. AG-Ba]|nr:tyrosinase [Ceratobasidium sp. AG-Ba]QRW03664.1 tyrosinase [Ceratobasidium sp. AG-Ba]
MRFTSVAGLVALSALVGAAPSPSPLDTRATGKCTNPVVRKEWRRHTVAEKKEFIRALQCIAKIPHQPNLYKTRITGGIALINTTATHYDDWVYLHMDSNMATHVVAQFFPWHRWYLHAFETDLKKKCDFKGTMPYWDWTLDAHDIYNSPIFESDPTYGLGTWGKAENDWHVTDGAFANSTRAYPVPHTIRRQFTPQPFGQNLIFPFEYANKTAWANETATPNAIEFMIDNFEGDSAAFFAAMEGPRVQGVHNAVHLMIGGDMSDPSPTPSDPLFWLHHGQLDRTWARWQARRPANARSFYGGSVQDLPRYDEYPVGIYPLATTKTLLPVSGMEAADVPIEEVMSITGNYTDRVTGFSGGRLCYTYDSM